MDESIDIVTRIITETETYFLVPAAPSNAYVGPGDIASGATVWGGLRAYNAAYATGSNPSIDIVDSGGSNAATINILSTGGLDYSTLNTWIGNHGTASVAKLYDQTGNGFHLTQATVSKMPTIVVSPGSSIATGLAVMLFDGATQFIANTSYGGSGIAQPFTMSCVAHMISASGNSAPIGAYSDVVASLFTSTSSVIAYAGNTGAHVTGLSTNFYALGLLFNSTASNMNVDGADTIGDGGTSNTGSAPPSFALGCLPTPTQQWFANCHVAEGGLWAANKSSNFSSLNSNIHTYWGF